MNTKGLKYYLLLISLISIFPIIQICFKPFKLLGLDGAYTMPQMPDINTVSFFNGSYQNDADIYIKDNAAFRGDLVRLRNQIDYSLFGNINTILTLGKDNYIFDPNYIWAREGKDLLTDSVLKRHELELVQGLKKLNKLNIPVLFCIAPNKANFYSKYLPVNTPKNNLSNQNFFINLLKKNNVFTIDFDTLFEIYKIKNKNILLPPFGAHWSIYGASLAADSIFKTINYLNNKTYQSFTQTGIEKTNKLRFTDDDYLPSMNLIWKWRSPEMSYPIIKFNNGDKPNILTISDSYFWSFYELGIIENCFDSKSEMWYYNKSVYNTKREKVKDRDSTISLHNLKQRDAIIILATGPSLKDFSYGFFHQLNNMEFNEK